MLVPPDLLSFPPEDKLPTSSPLISASRPQFQPSQARARAEKGGGREGEEELGHPNHDHDRSHQPKVEKLQEQGQIRRKRLAHQAGYYPIAESIWLHGLPANSSCDCSDSLIHVMASRRERQQHPGAGTGEGSEFLMLGSMMAPPSSSHRDCPTKILDGYVPPPPLSGAEEIVAPPLPSPTGAGVSSPSTSARPSWLSPFLASKNKGHVSSGEIAATANDSWTQDSLQGEKKRPPKAPPKKRLRSPLVPVVGSPGVNIMLSQASPRLVGVKRSSPTPSQIPGLAISFLAVDNIRESIKYVRSSPPRKKKFKDIVAQEGILAPRRAFTALKLQVTAYTCLPTNGEWETAEYVCKLLEVFLDATMVVSGTLYPTSHLYFHELWKIHLTLEREAKHEDIVIISMVQVMQKKFMKYWKLSYLTICLPVILDPRYKFKFLELCLKSGLESEAAKYLCKVQKTFKDLFVEYSSHDDDSTMENDQGTNNVATSINNPWDQWNKHVKEQQQNRAKLSELHIYLEDDVCPQEDGFDILCWRSTNAHKYPVISRIAKDVLAAPVSTVASESAFSTGGRILSDYRSRMVCSTVEALICLQDWMRPPGTTQVKTITSDVIYGTRVDIYGRSDGIFGD